MQLTSSFLGWQVDVSKLETIPKSIIIQAPHTSNWDFFVGIIAAKKSKIPFRFIIKDAWNIPIIGTILLKLGAIFINRSKSSGLTQRIAEAAKKMNQGHFIFTPEGTRSKVSKWKSGFYHIAHNAHMPIAIGYIDYKHKKIGIHDVFYPSGNIKADMATYRDFFNTVQPKHTKNYDPNWEI